MSRVTRSSSTHSSSSVASSSSHMPLPMTRAERAAKRARLQEQEHAHAARHAREDEDEDEENEEDEEDSEQEETQARRRKPSRVTTAVDNVHNRAPHAHVRTTRSQAVQSQAHAHQAASTSNRISASTSSSRDQRPPAPAPAPAPVSRHVVARPRMVARRTVPRADPLIQTSHPHPVVSSRAAPALVPAPPAPRPVRAAASSSSSTSSRARAHAHRRGHRVVPSHRDTVDLTGDEEVDEDIVLFERKSNARREARPPSTSSSTCTSASTTFPRPLEDCSVCLDSLGVVGSEHACLEGCSHRYHQRCIEQWMTRASTCPTCRREMISLKIVQVCAKSARYPRWRARIRCTPSSSSPFDDYTYRHVRSIPVPRRSQAVDSDYASGLSSAAFQQEVAAMIQGVASAPLQAQAQMLLARHILRQDITHVLAAYNQSHGWDSEDDSDYDEEDDDVDEEDEDDDEDMHDAEWELFHEAFGQHFFPPNDDDDEIDEVDEVDEDAWGW